MQNIPPSDPAFKAGPIDVHPHFDECSTAIVAKLMAGQHVNGEASNANAAVRPLIDKLKAAKPKDRRPILEGYLAALSPGDSSVILASIMGVDPEMPVPPPPVQPHALDGYDFGLMTVGDLDRAEFKLNYLIDGVLVEGQPCVVGGPRKALKTSTMIALALALASGRDFLGRFRVRTPKRVLFISGESGQSTTQETVRRVAASMGIDLDELGDMFHVGFNLPMLGRPEHLEALANVIRRTGAEVVILDPLYLCLLSAGLDVNASNLFEMGPLLASVSRTILDAGATPILVHHLRKNRDNPDAPPELEDLAFAGVQEFARQWLLLGRRTPYLPGTGHHELWLTYGGSAGHSGSWALDVEEGVADDEFQGRFWSTNLTPVGEARKNAQAEKAEAKEQAKREVEAKTIERHAVEIATTLRKKGPMTRNALRERHGLNANNVGRAITHAESQGWITPTDVTVPTGRGGSKVAPGYAYLDQSKAPAGGQNNPVNNPVNNPDCPAQPSQNNPVRTGPLIGGLSGLTGLLGDCPTEGTEPEVTGLSGAGGGA